MLHADRQPLPSPLYSDRRIQSQRHRPLGIMGRWLGLGLLGWGLMVGCGTNPKDEQTGNSAASGGGRPGQSSGPITVDVAIAAAKILEADLNYTGITEPRQRISLRSQVEGQLLDLTVDVGDRVKAGQVLGQLNDTLLRANLANAQAELVSQQLSQAEAETEWAEVQAEITQSQGQLEQASLDAQRLQNLAKDGAVSQQAAEQGETNRHTLEQTLKALQERSRTRQRGIQVAAAQVTAQEALVKDAQERLRYGQLVAPQDGLVMERLVDPGNLVQPGQAVLTLGDFSEIQVQVDVSDLDLGQVRPGQTVSITLDAFPGITLPGLINRIAPIADATAQLIPIEIRMPNPEGAVGAGLLARVTLPGGNQERVVVPNSALEVGESSTDVGNTAEIFVVLPQASAEGETLVEGRSVRLGRSLNGQVEVLQGLGVGDVYVVRSGTPLKTGQAVQRSLLSENPGEG
ncbi:efflux RND transporter periplasmic adaptor subunit [Prochlorothrix hollandica]|uniref:efflux RND transporter periplasmic adaptor subunit n=1 Tax=Prochlorothrix hollandica TaxID=1223 RepID=UPI00034DC336|nr:efflux RND transporter periplasmic adaptor subunit [Prochlorothrix hollandica]